MNLNKQQSEKYLEIVRHGNMDDMFDFGKECERQKVLSKVEGLLVDEQELIDGKSIGPNHIQEERNKLKAELRAKLAEMKEGK